MTGNGDQPLTLRTTLSAATRRPLYQEAAERIRVAILTGMYRPGERLREPNLARSLGLSRGPVREALRHLEQEGILVARPHMGVRVTTLDRKSVVAAIEIREFVELMYVADTAQLVDDEAIARLEALIELMTAGAEQGDAALVADSDVEFHELLLGIASPSVVSNVWRTISGQLRMCLAVGNEIFLREAGDVGRSHVPIVAALRKRDASGVQRALRHHLQETRDVLERIVSHETFPSVPDQHDSSSPPPKGT